MGAILAENKVHHLYWRTRTGQTKPTFGSTGGAVASGFEFENLFDNNSHTSFMIATASQSVHLIDFGANTFKFNGVAFYGHNFTTSQGLKIETSSDNLSYTNLSDSGSVYDATGIVKPTESTGKAFCIYLKGEVKTCRYLKITTSNWTESTFLSNLAIGEFVDGFNVSAPYTPPNFQPFEVSSKRNNQGNFLSSDVRKVPQKLNIRLSVFTEDTLSASTGVQQQIATGFDNTFIDYLGYHVARFPFFVMHDDGGSGTDSEIKADRNLIYFCTIDKVIRQPTFNSPTTLNWNINAIGYIS